VVSLVVSGCANILQLLVDLPGSGCFLTELHWNVIPALDVYCWQEFMSLV